MVIIPKNSTPSITRTSQTLATSDTSEASGRCLAETADATSLRLTFGGWGPRL